MSLNAENYSKGFMVDDDLIGGVTADPAVPGRFVAYVLRHLTGEYLGYQPFDELNQALDAINSVQRDWKFEAVGGCGNGKCGEGSCRNGKCGVAKAWMAGAPNPSSSCESGSCS